MNEDIDGVDFRSSSQRERDKRRQLIIKLKSVPCADCGKKYPYFVMDFDHRDPSQKLFTVSAMGTRSIKILLREIAKCDIVCANCHRIRSWTYGQHSRGSE